MQNPRVASIAPPRAQVSAIANTSEQADDVLEVLAKFLLAEAYAEAFDPSGGASSGGVAPQSHVWPRAACILRKRRGARRPSNVGLNHQGDELLNERALRLELADLSSRSDLDGLSNIGVDYVRLRCSRS